MKSLLIVFLFITFAFSKECYFNKVDEICYYKYFDRANIYKAKSDENYYIDKYKKIYTFDKTIEIRISSIGAIFTIQNDFGLEFVDKITRSTYLFKVSHSYDLFPTISKLNKLKTVIKAQPHRIRKYTNSYVNKKQEAKKARLEEVLKEATERLKNKKREAAKSVIGGGSQIKGNFLNPDAN